MRKQQGVTMFGMLIGCIVLVFLAIGGMKLVPAYIEYGKIKKAVVAVVQSGQAKGTVAEIRKAFEARRSIDDFEAVTANDLEISKDGNEVVLSFAYPKRIPLFANVSVLIDFEGSSKP